MTNPIQPIETRYAGCRFRSRLEARWAVFLDHLGIRWEYEPQGFDLDGRWYLPDFYLPAQQLWVEVKGTDAGLDLPALVRAAIHLPANPEGDPVEDLSRAGFRLLVLGPVPRAHNNPGQFRDRPDDAPVYTQPLHAVLHFWKGDVTNGFAVFGPGWIDLVEGGFLLGSDSGEVTVFEDGSYPTLTNGGGTLGPDPMDERVLAAYTAARSARFEHGEQG